MSSDAFSGARPSGRHRRASARDAALDLMPELAERVLPMRRARHRGIQTLLAAAAAAVIAATVAVPLALARDTGISSQVETPVTTLAAGDRSDYRDSAAAIDPAAAPAAPIVLSYHDIRPDPGAEGYAITPEAFESQLQMLDRAGYESLTLEQFRAYRDGSYTPPPRSFLLTFDDGTKGLWRHADPILERYDMTGVSFLITGSVETRQPYYLTWPEVEEMHRSGRWSFGSHTDDLHHRITVDASGDVGGALTHRTWATAGEDGATVTGRETKGAFRHRVGSDLDRSVAAMTAHGLPAPIAFSYPFSDEGDSADRDTAAALIAERFPLAFINDETPGPVAHRTARDAAVERLEVFTQDTHRTLFHEVTAMTTAPVTGAAPFDADSWATPERERAPVRTRDGTIRPDPGTTGFVEAQLAPRKTADWDDYTATARVTGLGPGTGTVGIAARVGSDQPVRVRLSARQAQVIDSRERVVGVLDLEDGKDHHATLVVDADHTIVRVDGVRVATAQTRARGTRTGGIGLNWSAAETGRHAAVSDVIVRPNRH